MKEKDSEGVLVHGLEEGEEEGESATHIIACSAWQCLVCGRAVACRFTHTRRGNMHVHINFPCLASVKTELFKPPASLPNVMTACWEIRSEWCKTEVSRATFMSTSQEEEKQVLLVFRHISAIPVRVKSKLDVAFCQVANRLELS